MQLFFQIMMFKICVSGVLASSILICCKGHWIYYQNFLDDNNDIVNIFNGKFKREWDYSKMLLNLFKVS